MKYGKRYCWIYNSRTFNALLLASLRSEYACIRWLLVGMKAAKDSSSAMWSSLLETTCCFRIVLVVLPEHKLFVFLSIWRFFNEHFILFSSLSLFLCLYLSYPTFPFVTDDKAILISYWCHVANKKQTFQKKGAKWVQILLIW